VAPDWTEFCHPCHVYVIKAATGKRGDDQKSRQNELKVLDIQLGTDSLLSPTTTCCLPRLTAASHDYLLPPTTNCCLPQLTTASHDYLLPSHNYLLPPTTRCDRLEKYLRHLALGYSVAAQKVQ
jgi:hypothetical protein